MASIHSVINYQSQKPKLIVVPSANMPAAIQGDNGYTYYKLTTSNQNSSIYFQNVEANGGLSIQILAIGGGGSGGYNSQAFAGGPIPGGGGAGGLQTFLIDYTVSGNTFNFISIGAGGANTVGSNTMGIAGGTTAFSYKSTTYSILGGGYGGGGGATIINGGNGACGGGGGSKGANYSVIGSGGTGTVGYVGGSSFSSTSTAAVGGGGGGMGSVGVSGTSSTSSACSGGSGFVPGTAISFLNTVSSTTFCIGGYGCTYIASPRSFSIGTTISTTYGSGGNANHNLSTAPTTVTTGQDGVIYFAYKIK